MRNRDYFISDYFFNGSAPEIDLFMLQTLDGTAALAEVIKFYIYDSSNSPKVDYIINVKRWYDDAYELVTMTRTNYVGNAATYVDFYDYYYELEILDTNNNIVKTINRSKFLGDELTIYITNEVTTSVFDENNNIVYNYTWNNVTGLFTINVLDTRLTPIDIHIIGTGSYAGIVCDKSYTTASLSAYCLFNETETNRYTVNVMVTSNEQEFNLLTVVIDEIERIALGRSGLFYTFLIVMAFSLMGISISIQTVPLLGCFGLLLSNMFGFIIINPIMLAGLFFAGFIITTRFTR